MGLLRFILAAAVVGQHSTGFPILGLVDGRLAVNLFFIISGFYMSLILGFKYKDHYRLFITNRFFRLAPTYYLVLGLSIFVYLAVSIYQHSPHDRLIYWVEAWRHQQWGTLTLMSVVQCTILGLDIPGLLSYTPAGNLSFFAAPGCTPGFRFLFLPQAWTISMEFSFYLLAPFLVRFSTRNLVLLATTSAGLNIFLRFFLYHGINGPFTYQFLLPQIYLFILGILTFRYAQLERERIPATIYKLIIAVFIFLLFFAGIQFSSLMEVPLYAVATVSVPYLFNLTRSFAWDRWIGELSYPIYMLHVFINWLMHGTEGLTAHPVSGYGLLFWTILASIAVTELVEKPVGRWRQTRVRKEEPEKFAGESDQQMVGLPRQTQS